MSTGGTWPRFGDNVWMAPGSFVLGQVELGNGVVLLPGASVRGDAADGDDPCVSIGDDTNVQDNASVHADPGFPARIGRGVSMGHNCVVHGCTIGDYTIVGMGAVVLNGAVVGKGCLIGAGAVVREGQVIPDGSLVAGVPAKVVRTDPDRFMALGRMNAQAYCMAREAYASGAISIVQGKGAFVSKL